jgi:hypothetical protein
MIGRYAVGEITKHFKFRIAECKKRDKELGKWGNTKPDEEIGRNKPYVGLS